jgi:hypothetical protein
VVLIKAIALNVFAPAGAIATGALLQQLVISAWPGAQSHAILNVSVDSYFAAVVLACLTFWVGLGLKRRAPGRAVMAASFIFPIIWLLLFQFAVYPPSASLSALRVVFTAIAIAPLVGLGVAYGLPSNNRWRGP